MTSALSVEVPLEQPVMALSVRMAANSKRIMLLRKVVGLMIHCLLANT
jgi:hypothetical protein